MATRRADDANPRARADGPRAVPYNDLDLRRWKEYVGVELKPGLVEHVRGKLPPAALASDVRLLEGDSADPRVVGQVRAALADLGRSPAQLLILHPPYDDIIRFSDRPEDLSNSAGTEEFLAWFATAARHGYMLLDPGRFAVLVIGDRYSRGELVPLGFCYMEKMNEVGFRAKAHVVKKVEGDEVGKGRRNNLWRYRALAGGFYIFRHEYVMIFGKAGGPPCRS